MSKFRRNIFISFLFFLALLLFSVAVDRVVGVFQHRDAVSEGLIFPPHSIVRYQTPEFDFTANINSLGFRDREFDLDKDGKTRILAIGDSFTYGWGVDVADSWPKLLEANLRQMSANVEIANLGQPGASPAVYEQIVDKAVPILKPDFVIVCILQGDDLMPDRNWGRSPESSAPSSSERPISALSLTSLRSRISAAGRGMYPNFFRLISSRLPTPPLRALWKNQADSIVETLTPEERKQFDKVDARVRQSFMDGELNPALIQSVVKEPNYFLDTLDINKPEVKSLISVMSRHLARIKETADQYHCRVVVISAPYKVYASRRDVESSQRLGLNLLPEMAESDSADKAIEMACQSAGVNFIEVTNEFRQAANATPLYYEMDGHLNSTGHRVFAHLLTPQLAQLWFEAKTN